jgi:hypothetical protein
MTADAAMLERMSFAGPRWLLALLCIVVAVQHARADAGHVAEPTVCDAAAGRKTITEPDAYVRVLHCTFEGRRPKVGGLMARVLKGKSDTDFETLSEDRDRKIVFLMGSDGLERLVGATNDQILAKIGYTADYVARLEREGYRFKLVVFKSGPDSGQLATWEHVVELVVSTYPDIAAKVTAALPRLKRTSFARIEKQAPSRFAIVDSVGRDHEDYVDEGRLKTLDGALWQVRAFLYYRIRLTELYAGDGITRTVDRKKHLKEYIAPNKAIRDLLGARTVDL